MGIGNLNNNLGSLTSKPAINKTNAEKINSSELTKTQKANADVLNSATLKDSEGNVFDSNSGFNLNEPTLVSQAKNVMKARGNGKSYGENLRNRLKEHRDECDKHAYGEQNSHTMIGIVSVIQAAFDTWF